MLLSDLDLLSNALAFKWFYIYVFKMEVKVMYCSMWISIKDKWLKAFNNSIEMKENIFSLFLYVIQLDIN